MVSTHRPLLQQCNVALGQLTRRPAADLEESPPPYVVVLNFDKSRILRVLAAMNFYSRSVFPTRLTGPVSDSNLFSCRLSCDRPLSVPAVEAIGLVESPISIGPDSVGRRPIKARVCR